jgi:type I restriction enzyme, S subunit
MSECPLVPLGELVDNYDFLRVPVKEADRRNGPFPYYGASGIIDYIDSYIFDGLYLLIAEDGENLRTRRQPIAFQADGKFWVNNHVHIVRGNEKADTRFLLYTMQVADINSYLTGSTMPKLTQNNLNRIPIPAPAFATQIEIASILSALDDKIELNRRMNETLEGMARAIFRDWFVDFGPTRAKMAGRPPYLAPDLWSLFPDRLDEDGKPEGWETSTIGDEVTVVGGSTPSTTESGYWNGAIHWATPKDLASLQAPVLLATARRITEAGLETISSGLLPRGTVLLSSRAPIGYLAITEIPVAVNQGFIALVCNRRLSNVFVWLWAHESMEAILQRANGSTFQEISKRNFRPLPVVAGCDRIEVAFDETVKPLYRRIAQNEVESRTLAEIRDLLLPKLMFGEIRVRAAEREVEAVV